jgi:hypothetical protein
MRMTGGVTSGVRGGAGEEGEGAEGLTLMFGGVVGWGWRAACLVNLVMVVLAAYVRIRLLETPEFCRVRRQKRIVRWPIVAVGVLVGLGGVGALAVDEGFR